MVEFGLIGVVLFEDLYLCLLLLPPELAPQLVILLLELCVPVVVFPP